MWVRVDLIRVRQSRILTCRRFSGPEGNLGFISFAALHEQTGKENGVNGDDQENRHSDGGLALGLAIEQTLRANWVGGVHDVGRNSDLLLSLHRSKS